MCWRAAELSGVVVARAGRWPRGKRRGSGTAWLAGTDVAGVPRPAKHQDGLWAQVEIPPEMRS